MSRTCLVKNRLISSTVLKLMEKHSVVPDVIDEVPKEVVQVVFSSSRAKAQMGNILTPTQVKDQPTVKWTATDDSLYTLCMTDPDAPSRKQPKFREWHHWLVGNIPGCDVSKGHVLSEYIGAGPPKNTGLHRYVILVYKQNGQIQFNETYLTNRSGKNRGRFSIRNFAAKYNLGSAIAGNFFQAEFDNYVPKLYKQLGQ